MVSILLVSEKSDLHQALEAQGYTVRREVPHPRIRIPANVDLIVISRADLAGSGIASLMRRAERRGIPTIVAPHVQNSIILALVNAALSQP